MVSQQPSEKECTNQSRSDCETTRKMLKTEKEVELSKVSPTCTTSYPLFGCRKSRRNLTEVMLANCLPHVIILFFQPLSLPAYFFRLKRKKGEYEEF